MCRAVPWRTPSTYTIVRICHAATRATRATVRSDRDDAAAVRGGLAELVQVHRDELRHARLLHRHAVEVVGRFHRPLVVRDDDELRTIRHLAHELVVAIDVRLVERRVDL